VRFPQWDEPDIVSEAAENVSADEYLETQVYQELEATLSNSPMSKVYIKVDTSEIAQGLTAGGIRNVTESKVRAALRRLKERGVLDYKD
jgi:hypothetical protein